MHAALFQPLNQKGPNNTILYHQRYYPEEFLAQFGDVFASLPQSLPATGRQTTQSYPAQAPRSQYTNPAPQSYRPSSSEDDSIYGGNSAAISQPAAYPSYSQNQGYVSAAQSKPERASPKPYPSSYSSSSYPSSYSQPKPATTYAPAPAPYQQPARVQSYQPQTYAPQSYPQYAPAATKPAATATSYTPSVNYASQPTYKKVSAASVAPVAPKPSAYAPYASYPATYATSSPKVRTYVQPASVSYASPISHKASSSLVDEYPTVSLKSGVTYESDDY